MDSAPCHPATTLRARLYSSASEECFLLGLLSSGENPGGRIARSRESTGMETGQRGMGSCADLFWASSWYPSRRVSSASHVRAS
jgi:hypothetical protein